jgi:hypothetical protein
MSGSVEGEKGAGWVGSVSFMSVDSVDAELLEFAGQVFEEVMEFVADVSGAESGAFRDFPVFQVLHIFEAKQFLVRGLQLSDGESEMALCLESPESFIGSFTVGFWLTGGIADDLAFGIAVVIGGAVAHTAVEPGNWFAHFVPMGMELEEGVLDDLFSDLAATGQAVGVVEKFGFLGEENVVQGVPFARFGGLRSHGAQHGNGSGVQGQDEG